MLIEIDTQDGPRKVRVCSYCKTVCIPSGRFCSGHCCRAWHERERREFESKLKEGSLE